MNGSIPSWIERSHVRCQGCGRKLEVDVPPVRIPAGEFHKRCYDDRVHNQIGVGPELTRAGNEVAA
jgi:hypothetical protein